MKLMIYHQIVHVYTLLMKNSFFERLRRTLYMIVLEKVMVCEGGT